MTKGVIIPNLIFNFTFGILQAVQGRVYWPQAILFAFFLFMLYLNIKKNYKKINFKRFKVGQRAIIELNEPYPLTSFFELPSTFEAELTEHLLDAAVFEVKVEFNGSYPLVLIHEVQVFSIQKAEAVKKVSPKDIYSRFCGGVK